MSDSFESTYALRRSLTQSCSSLVMMKEDTDQKPLFHCDPLDDDENSESEFILELPSTTTRQPLIRHSRLLYTLKRMVMYNNGSFRSYLTKRDIALPSMFPYRPFIQSAVLAGFIGYKPKQLLGLCSLNFVVSIALDNVLERLKLFDVDIDIPADFLDLAERTGDEFRDLKFAQSYPYNELMSQTLSSTLMVLCSYISGVGSVSVHLWMFTINSIFGLGVFWRQQALVTDILKDLKQGFDFECIE